MVQRKQDPQDMETLQEYRHTHAREGFSDSDELQTNISFMPYVQLYERMILNTIAPVIEQRLIMEQAGFRPGKPCISQLLNMTQNIEDAYHRGMITGAAFVNIYAAYDTVNHILPIHKLYNINSTT